MTTLENRIETRWRGGDASGAMALARAAGREEEKLAAAEALLRCAADLSLPHAEDAARLAVALRAEVWPVERERAAFAAMPLADLLRRAGRHAEADAVLAQCEELAAAAFQRGAREPLRIVLLARAKLHETRGRHAEAERALLRAAELEAVARPGRAPGALALAELAALYRRQARFAEAADIQRREIDARRAGGLSAHEHAILLTELGRTLLRAGQEKAARNAIRDALSALAQTPAEEPLRTMARTVLDEIAARGGPGEDDA